MMKYGGRIEALITKSEALNKLVLSIVEWIQTSNDKTGSYEQALYMHSLSNCPKLSDEPRVTLLRPAQLRRAGKRLSTPLPKSERNHLFIRNFSLERAIIFLYFRRVQQRLGFL